MKLNFTHILANLGFDGVSPIYWIKESKHAIKYTYSKYACTRLSRTKRRYNLNKTPRKSRRHTKVWHYKSYSNYIKEPNQHMIDTKVQHKNYINKKWAQIKTKHTCSKIYLIQDGKTNIKERDNELPKGRARFKEINQTLHTFMMAQSTNKKWFIFQTQTSKDQAKF